VKDIHLVDTFNLEMQKIGYVAKGENGIAQRRYFQKVGTIARITFTFIRLEAVKSQGIWPFGII